jgi:hypothetical protein
LISHITGEHSLRKLNNDVLRKIFGRKASGGGKNYIMKSFMICTHQIILEWSDQGRGIGTYRGEEKCIGVFGGKT